MAIDQILKRNFWAPTMLFVAIGAYFNAQAITQLVGIGVSADATQLAAAPLAVRAVPTGGTTVRNVTADPILARNPFDHTTGPLRAAPTADTAGPSIDLSDPYNAPACDGVKVLVIAASAEQDWSFAAVSASGEPKTVMRRRGGEVGGKKVRYVGWDRVWLESGSTLCQAELFKSADAPKVAAIPTGPAVSSPPPVSGGAPALDPAIQKGIVRVSANEFNVDRGVVDKILENQADLMRQARIVPEQENGKMVGIRLFGVRPDTLLGVIGMENGDRLQTINGFDMTSPEKALEAYARLRTADKLTVQVNRRGQNMNLDYNIK